MTTPPPQDPFSQPSGTPAAGSGPSYGNPPPYGSTPSYGPPPTGSSYGPPPSYGAPLQGYGPPPAHAGGQSVESKAIIALVCAIGSFVVFPVIPAIVALVLVSSSQREIDASGGRLTGSGFNTASKVIAWTNLVLSALGLLLVVLAVGLFASVGFS